MKILKLTAFEFVLILVLQFLSYWMVGHYSFIPVVESAIIGICNLLCLLTVAIFFRLMWPRMLQKTRLVRNSYFILSFIAIVLVISIGIFLTLATSRTYGLYHSCQKEYSFPEKNIRFYLYRNGYESEWTTLRYSRGKEWVNHPVKGLFFSKDPHVVIMPYQEYYIINGNDKIYRFQPGQSNAVLLGQPGPGPAASDSLPSTEMRHISE